MKDMEELFVEVDEETKREAEEILRELGLTMEVALELFFREIVHRNGLPFEMDSCEAI